MDKSFFGICTLCIGLVVVIFAMTITIRCYMPCPFWDEWVVVDAIAKGAGPGNWSWLWSQQNEHRLVVPRLLVWFDLFAGHGKTFRSSLNSSRATLPSRCHLLHDRTICVVAFVPQAIARRSVCLCSLSPQPNREFHLGFSDRLCTAIRACKLGVHPRRVLAILARGRHLPSQ